MASIPKSKPAHKTKPLAPNETFSLVSNEKLLAIYAAMVKCRMIQQRATLLFQQGKLASDLHESSGREATAVAVGIDLQPDDSLSLAAGDWLPGVVKGMPLESLFRALAPASAQLNSGSTSPLSALEHHNVFAGEDKTQRPALIRDRALAALEAKDASIAAAILPSNDKSLKIWQDVLAAAASQKLPIVFVHYANVAEQPGTQTPARKSKNPDALFHGVPAIAVDALDAVAVYRVAYEAILRARQGRGATLLECVTHIGIPAHKRASDEPSPAPPSPSDSVSMMETYLKSKGIEAAQHNKEIVTAFHVELDLATRFLGP